MLSEKIGKLIVGGLVVASHAYIAIEKFLFSKEPSFKVESGVPENWDAAIEQAGDDVESLQSLWEVADSGSREEARVWIRLWECSETLPHWRWIWKRCPHDSEDHENSWNIVKKLASEQVRI